MKRLSSLLAVVVLSASLLSGCGGGGTDAYCDTLKDTQKDFDDFESADFSNFDQFTERVDKLADEAPDEVKDDWKVLKDAFHGFVDALGELVEVGEVGGLEVVEVLLGVLEGVAVGVGAAASATAQEARAEDDDSEQG